MGFGILDRIGLHAGVRLVLSVKGLCVCKLRDLIPT